jgi:hypothetical protein
LFLQTQTAIINGTLVRYPEQDNESPLSIHPREEDDDYQTEGMSDDLVERLGSPWIVYRLFCGRRAAWWGNRSIARGPVASGGFTPFRDRRPSSILRMPSHDVAREVNN